MSYVYDLERRYLSGPHRERLRWWQRLHRWLSHVFGGE